MNTMVTVYWWVLPALVFAGGFLGSLVIAFVWDHTKSMAKILAEVLANPEEAPAPEVRSWQPPSPPWADHGLTRPADPEVDTTWHGFGPRVDGSLFAGEDTSSFAAIGFRMPGPDPVEVQADEPKPEPRARFAEPAAPRELVVTTTVGDVVQSERIEVPS